MVSQLFGVLFDAVVDALGCVLVVHADCQIDIEKDFARPFDHKSLTATIVAQGSKVLARFLSQDFEIDLAG